MSIASASRESATESERASRAITVNDEIVSTKVWQAKLDLDFSRGPKRTFVHRSHRGPLSMQRPFYPEGDVCHVTVLHPPGGVVSGDQLLTAVQVNPGARALVVTPGATKHYRSRTADTNSTTDQPPIGVVRQRLNIDGGSLEWLPNEAIHFDGSESRIETQFNLYNDARLIALDVQVFGRRAGNLPFLSGQADIALSVFHDELPLLMDRMRVSKDTVHNSAAGLRGYTVYGTLVASHATNDLVELLRRKLKPIMTEFSEGELLKDPSTAVLPKVPLRAPLVAVSRIDQLLIVRYLGDRSDQALSVLRSVRNAIRPSVIGRASYTPRIWST